MAETVGETGEHQFAFRAQGPELCAQQAVSAQDSASSHACPHQENKKEDTPTPESLHSFSRPVGYREKGEPWAQSQNLLHQRPCAWPPVCQDTR